jgi:chromosome segregation ATPase
MTENKLVDLEMQMENTEQHITDIQEALDELKNTEDNFNPLKMKLLNKLHYERKVLGKLRTKFNELLEREEDPDLFPEEDDY